MSETANPIVPTTENNTSVLKPEQEKPATNDVNNETPKINNDVAPVNEAPIVPAKEVATTPAAVRQPRRKRASEAIDSSLVIDTPGGDGGRRQTRSQTRGTPAPTPIPAKKPALEKSASNGSASKGRRGRPPKAAVEEKPVELVAPSAPVEEIKEETKPTEPEKEVVVEKPKVVEPVKPAETKVDGVTSTTGEKVTPPEVKVPEKKEEAPPKPEPEAKVEQKENSQEVAKEKVIEKPAPVVPEVTEKPLAVGENKVVNNENAETVNNHEQA